MAGESAGVRGPLPKNHPLMIIFSTQLFVGPDRAALGHL